MDPIAEATQATLLRILQGKFHKLILFIYLN